MRFNIWILLAGAILGLSVAVEPKASGREVVSQLKKLAKFSDDPSPAVTRVLFTQQDVEARNYIKSLMSEAGLIIHEDAMGNIFGTLNGIWTDRGTVASGSHTDAIPLAGMYDGTLGVVGAIAALKALKDVGFKPKRPITAVMFTSEEPTRFGLGCIGSRGMAGALTSDILDQRVDENGTTFSEAAANAGYLKLSHSEILRQSKVHSGEISAFVELHIEQGPTLEAEGKQIGVVTAIAAPAALIVRFKGSGGHAGALLMSHRHDASLAAAQVVLDVEKAALATGAVDTVATVGRIEISPNTVNSVPREAKLEVDIRDTSVARRNSVVKDVIASVRRAGESRGLEYSVGIVNQDPPARCDKKVVASVEKAALQLGASHTPLVSRAYHDSLFMAQIAPTGMIFIPCRNGWSHRPDEYASEEDIEMGVNALAIVLAQLSNDADVREEL